ncbi:hypothetical protein NIES4071_13420 [Calothrix sp. NIES-4071]|nr:hypothetical protein NIES4071_13420 [Calothrix sp. NIES-4071]BAZ55681.1 hypothetical protein NIES4105_13380 [Calothrix sp. NIES-4105]
MQLRCPRTSICCSGGFVSFYHCDETMVNSSKGLLATLSLGHIYATWLIASITCPASSIIPYNRLLLI